MMKYIKKLLALALVLSMVTVPINVKATSPTLSGVTPLLDRMVQEMFTSSYKGKIADLVQVIYDIDDRQAFTRAYAQAFNILDQEANGRGLSDFPATVDAITALVNFIDANDHLININNVTTYIRQGDKTSFMAALTNHEVAINQLIVDAGLTEGILSRGFNKLDGLVAAYTLAMNYNYKFFTHTTNTGQLSVRTTEVTAAINILNSMQDLFDDVDNVVACLNKLVDYYNNSQNTSDKNIVLQYLKNEGIVYDVSTTGGNTGDNTGGNTQTGTNQELNDITADITSGHITDKEATEKVAKVVNGLENTLKKVNSISAAYDALRSVSDVLGSAEQVVSALGDEEAVVAVVGQVKDVLQGSMKALSYIDKPFIVTTKAKSIIKDVAKISKAVDDKAKSTLLETVALAMAELAIEKSGAVDAAGQINTNNGKATIDLSHVDYADSLEKVKQTSQEMKALLKDNKLAVNRDLRATLTLNVPTTEENVEVTLPDLENAFEAVDVVSVDTGLATFTLSADTFSTTSTISLSADTVSGSQLTTEQQAALPQGVGKVIDFNATVAGEKVETFSGILNVAIPYELDEGQNPEKVSVYLLTEEGTIEKVAGKYDVATGKITVARKHLSKYYASVSTDTFADLSRTEWAKQAVEVLAGKGIIAGKGNYIFDPSGKITRAECVVLISRMLQLEDDGTGLPFKDVDMKKWYAQDVAAAYQNNVISGKSAKEFAPTDIISRQEAAQLISNALAYIGIKGETNSVLIKDHFGDMNSIAYWAKKAVATAYREGIINGKPGKVFDPTGDLTRAEVAKMIYKLYFLY